MASFSEPRLLAWTIPTPQGLWNQGFVLLDKGLFVTPRLNATTMEGLREAVAEGPRAAVEALTDHGRSKRPDYLPWPTITAVKPNAAAGSIEITTADRLVEVRVPDRDKLDKLALVVQSAWKSLATNG